VEDLRDIEEVKELHDVEQVNALLKTGHWKLLSAKDGETVYVLGRQHTEPEEEIEWI
jgi:hypothetical protein